MAKVSSVTTIPTAVDVLTADSVSKDSGSLYCCWRPCCFWLPCSCCLPAVVGVPVDAGVPNMVKIPFVTAVFFPPDLASCGWRL